MDVAVVFVGGGDGDSPLFDNSSMHHPRHAPLHIAAGGVAATPKLLDKLCKQMVEKNLDDSIEFAIQNLDKFIQPISDLRGSSYYRLEAMKGLFRRLQICLRQDKESLSIMEI